MVATEFEIKWPALMSFLLCAFCLQLLLGWTLGKALEPESQFAHL